MRQDARDSQTYKPGEIVKVSGLYTASHRYKKRSYNLLLLEGQRFPECNCCGSAVRFAVDSSAPYIAEDSDFRRQGSRISKVVLCVCDDPAKLLCRSVLLLGRGFKVYQAENSEVATRIIGHCWPDCILLEYTPSERRAVRNVAFMKRQCAEVKFLLANRGYSIPKALLKTIDSIIESSDPAELVEQLENLLMGKRMAA